MTLQSVGGNIVVPWYVALMSGAIPYAAVLDANASTDYVAAIIKFPASGKLLKVGIRTSTVTTADPINVTIETVDPATGAPSGSLYAAGASGSVAAPASNTTYWVEINGANGIDVNLGDIVAIRLALDYTDGNLQVYIKGSAAHTYAFPYVYEYLNSSATLRAQSINIGLEYQTLGIIPFHLATPATVSGPSSTWSDSDFKKGLVFQVPYKCRVSGAIIYADIDNDAQMLFYDSDQATALETITLDKDIRQSTSGGFFHIPFSASRILTINTNYRLVIQPSAGGNITYQYLTVTDDGAFTAMSGVEFGTTWQYTECNGAPANEASWSNTATQRPLFGLIIDQLDDGANSGGGPMGIISPVISGGHPHYL